MTGPLQERAAVVTGGAQGIGKAIALRLAQAGAALVIVDIDAEAGETVASSINDLGGSALFVRTDVGEERDVQRLIDVALRARGRIDILINNAGISLVRALPDTSDEIWFSTQRVNLRGVFLVSKYTLPSMIKLRAGTIVNIASMLAFVAEPETSAYSASKGAVANLTRAMAVDYAPHGIRVNAICPGYVDTRMARDDYTDQELQEGIRRHPLSRLAQPEEIAETVVFLSGEGSSFITGACILVDGGYTAW